MSGMVLKSVTACVVSMAAAAGVTWFGTAPAATAGESAHPHRMDKATSKSERDHDAKHERGEVHGHDAATHDAATVETKPKRMSDRSTSRVVVTSEAERAATTDLPENGTTRSVIRRLLRSEENDVGHDRSADAGESGMHAHNGNAPHSHSGSQFDSHDTDRTRIKRRMTSDADGKTVDVEVFVMDKEGADEASKAFRDMVEAERLAMREGRDMDAKMEVELDAMIADMTGGGMHADKDGMRAFYKAKPSELLATSENIEDSDLRDQALYAVTTYALRFDDFKAANEAVSRIKQRDLRDTARSRMAIRHGELGHIDKALSTIEKLENEDLRDIIRVQMIETLTTPVGQRKSLPGY